jgi:hypothetical protein
LSEKVFLELSLGGLMSDRRSELVVKRSRIPYIAADRVDENRKIRRNPSLDTLHRGSELMK